MTVEHASNIAATTPSPDAPPLAARWYSEKRLSGLTRFAISITILNIAGHLFLGFEQSWATPFVALAATYGVELLGETCDAWASARRPRFAGSVSKLIDFLLPAHISGLAIGMLLYAGERLWPVAFAAATAIASKYVFRTITGRTPEGRPIYRHWLNPSNFGIAITLVLFPQVGIAQPYQFTENTSGLVDWLLPVVIIAAGTFLNLKATGRVPLIVAWLAAFAVQALVRAAISGAPWNAGLEPMTGFAFVLFTFYMITDPATTPTSMRGQVVFAVTVAAVYAVLIQLHVVFGLFFALGAVTGLRGLCLLLGQRVAPLMIGQPALQPTGTAN